MSREEPSDKRRYQSRYSPGKWISAPQWLGEEMCRRQAIRKKTALPVRFWETHPEWAKVLRNQVRLAAGLFQRFEATVIGQALRSPEGLKIWSLGSDKVGQLCQRYKRMAERSAEQAALRPVSQDGGKPTPDLPSSRPPFVEHCSILSRLRGA